MNRVELTGRIANDLELRKTPNNKSVLKFNIAVDKGKKDQQGNKQVDFITVQCWEHNADFLDQYAFKGVMIGVSGRIETSSFNNKDGQRVSVTFVTAENVEILSKPQQSETVHVTKREQENFGTTYSDIKDDDLPFY